MSDVTARRFAVIGAMLRLTQLADERASIMADFPELRQFVPEDILTPAKRRPGRPAKNGHVIEDQAREMWQARKPVAALPPAPPEADAQAPAAPEKRKRDKPHWMQTPEGKANMAKVMKKRWREAKKAGTRPNIKGTMRRLRNGAASATV